MSGLDNTSYTTRSVTAATDLTNNDSILFVSPTGGNVVVSVAPATSFPPGRLFRVRRDATATNTVTVTPTSGTINGTTTLAVGSAGSIGSVTIVSDGTEWKSV